MKRLIILVAGVALAAVPALSGLTGNPGPSHRVPVRVPVGEVPRPVVGTQTGDAARNLRRTADIVSPSPTGSRHAQPGATRSAERGDERGNAGEARGRGRAEDRVGRR